MAVPDTSGGKTCLTLLFGLIVLIALWAYAFLQPSGPSIVVALIGTAIAAAMIYRFGD